MWAQDFLAKHQSNKHVINDSKTPSGPVHIGSMWSFIIHDVLKRILDEEKHEAIYLYGFDDYDPMDDVPPGYESLSEHLGKPLCNVPSSDGKHESFAIEIEDDYRKFHHIVGVHPTEYYHVSEIYKSGCFNEQIRRVLDNADKIRKIYAEISGSKREPDWLPVQPICPQCGKIGTTYAYAWDGEKVKFTCRKDLVDWAEGCGYQGEISPFDGNAKMHWRVEWPAKWDLFNVTIEWAGKDHANKGSSFDTGRAILKEVFGKEGIALEGHEFFLMDGKKMSSSKGRSVRPQDALEIFAPEVFRFLFIRTRPRQTIEIDLAKVVPQTYDEYDRCQLSYIEHADADQSDFFYYSQIDPKSPDSQVHSRFSSVVNLVQLPGSNDELEKKGVAPRVPYAKTWLQKYAPEDVRFYVTDSLPAAVSSLTSEQKSYLAAAVSLVTETDEEKLQSDLYELSKSQSLPTKEAFASIYTAFIGKPHGPRAGILLSSLDPEFVKKRLLEASA